MSVQKDFDAYYKWLGIPPHQQPPTHYRLLGLEPLESDLDVIQAAAERQMAHVQSYKIGPQSELSQRLLNEIARAKNCLLNVSSKTDYDRGLRQQLSVQSPRDVATSQREAVAPIRGSESIDATPLWKPKTPIQTSEGGYVREPAKIQFVRPNVLSIHAKLAKDRRSNNQLFLFATLGIAAAALAVALIVTSDRTGGGKNEATAKAASTDEGSGSASEPDLTKGEIDNTRPATNADPVNPTNDAKTAPNQSPEPGFVPLFNGRDLTGWTGKPNCFLVRDGSLVHTGLCKGNLYTDKEFSNFILRFDYKLTSGADNGIGIRTPLEGDPALVGMEIQLLDETAERFRDVASTQLNGSVCGLAIAGQGAQLPLGSWNSEEIVVDRRRIKVTLNGLNVLDQDLDVIATVGGEANRKHLGLRRTEGHIALMADTPEVEFRNIRIKTLPVSSDSPVAPMLPPVVEKPLQPGEFPEIVLPSAGSISQETLSLSKSDIQKLFSKKGQQFFVLTDPGSQSPVGLFAFRKTGVFDGPAIVVDENGRPSVALSYSGDQRNQILRTWSSDGSLVLRSEYRFGRKAGITCLCDEGRPVRIEVWGASQNPIEYLVEYEKGKAIVTAKKHANPEQLIKLVDTGKAVDNIERLIQSHERQWKMTFKKWWSDTEQQLRSSPDAANKQIERESREGKEKIIGRM